MSQGNDRPTVPEILRSGAETFEGRNPVYGSSYKGIGAALAGVFPEGLPAMDAEGWNRFACWFMVFGKLHRYSGNFARGGHQDSAHDAMVYAAMLEELTK